MHAEIVIFIRISQREAKKRGAAYQNKHIPSECRSHTGSNKPSPKLSHPIQLAPSASDGSRSARRPARRDLRGALPVHTPPARLSRLKHSPMCMLHSLILVLVALLVAHGWIGSASVGFAPVSRSAWLWVHGRTGRPACISAIL